MKVALALAQEPLERIRRTEAIWVGTSGVGGDDDGGAALQHPPSILPKHLRRCRRLFVVLSLSP